MNEREKADLARELSKAVDWKETRRLFDKRAQERRNKSLREVE